MAVKKKAIVFVDGNNWYHNVKSVIAKPRGIDFRKMANMIAGHFGLEIVGIRYYNSVPDIEFSEEVYYKHMVYLASLKQKGLDVNTAKLKKMRVNGKTFVVEKGIDIMIATDMFSKVFLESECECCVLVSGDSDFVPAMRLIKSSGNEVLTVSVLKGYARELLQGEFRFWILKKGDVEKCFKSS
jgi:uncharacterized LabA/DUF88 family protein